jgi:hypothetical protein
MGGHVDRFYLARTKGFTDTAMTIETLAGRWSEIMTGTSEDISLPTEADPRAWSSKPYVPCS